MSWATRAVWERASLRECAERKEDRSCTARACRAFPTLGRRESRRRRGAGLEPSPTGRIRGSARVSLDSLCLVCSLRVE